MVCILMRPSSGDLQLSIAVASVEEYITMVAGGLAGASPHMISATITALSRLVFEFKGTFYRHLCVSSLTLVQ